MRYYRSRALRRCALYVAALCVILLLAVSFLQKEAANGCGATEDAHPCLEKLFPLVLKSLESLDISLHYLCYYSLWGALKIGEPLPWTNRIELCVQNEELLAKADEGAIVKAFRRNGLEVRYDSANGLYYAWHDADVRCQVYLYVFELQDGQSAWRVGWKHRLKSSKVCEGSTCFPARLVKAPLKQLDFMGLPVNVPHEDFEIQKYLYPDSWWKELPKFRGAEIVRSRDYITIHKADARVDIGGAYDLERWSFDHHQPTFKVTMAELRPELKNADIKLSSAGLIYHHFGQIIIGAQMKKDPEDPDVKNVFRMVYENFIREIDGIDNGINASDGDIRYSITTGVSSRVAHLNARWNENLSEEDILHRFHKAMNLVGKEFRGRVDYYEKSWIPARELVLQAVASRYEVNETGQIIILSKGGCPWKGHLYDIEEAQNIKGQIKYVIFEDVTHRYRVQAVAIKDGSFGLRLPLPWKGLRDEHLCRETNIPGCIFVHSNGFIGGNKTKEGAIQMAIKALEIHNRI